MHFRKITTLLGIAAVSALAVVPGAGAQQPTSSGYAAPAAKVTGAYLHIEKLQPNDQRYATLVFKTDRQLPRRYDGLIRAGAGIAGQNGSVGSVHGKASRCYVVRARIKDDNTITGTTADGKITHTKARAGSKLPVEITTAKGATTVKRTLTLRNAKAGDASGKPLGC